MKTDIPIYQFKDDLPLGFEIVSLTDLFAKSRDLFISPHRTAFYHIIWFRKGGFTLTLDFYPLRVEDNLMLFLNKDIVHVYDKTALVDGKAILFTDTFFCQSEIDTRFLKETILFNHLFPVSAIQLLNDSTVFNNLWELMEAETGKQADQHQGKILRSYLYNFLIQAEREKRMQGDQEIKKSPDLDCLLLFKDLLEVHFKSNKQVNFYASKTCVTEKRLNQAITKVLGKTAKQLIDDRIILEARRKLTHSNDSVKVIARCLGFEEPTNFIKYFRKHTKQTPVEFRENLSHLTSA